MSWSHNNRVGSTLSDPCNWDLLPNPTNTGGLKLKQNVNIRQVIKLDISFKTRYIFKDADSSAKLFKASQDYAYTVVIDKKDTKMSI